MLSSVLNSERAILVNIAIMQTFVKIREILSTHKELAYKLSQLERKIEKHDEETRLNEYKTRLFKGEDMDIAIRSTEKRIEDLRREHQELLNRFEGEGLVVDEMPEPFSVAVLLPQESTEGNTGP